MITWGINALNHGSSLAIFSGGDLVKFDICKTDELDKSIIYSALNYGGPSQAYWYERPLVKKARQLIAGQYDTAFDLSVMPRRYLNRNNLSYCKIKYTPHHASHAAAGYYTSPFNDAAIVVLDAIGEFECASIWKGSGNNIKKIWSRTYPNSLGLFYSAFTKLIGYQPIVEEHLLQRDSDLGDSNRYYYQIKDYFDGIVSLKHNFHRGVGDWPDIKDDQGRYDIAAAVQRVFEEQVDLVMITAQHLTNSKNLVYMGGCSMNSKYNKRLGQRWDRVWSLPQPGDPSSAVGAVLYHTKKKINWNYGIAKHLEIIV
jgi:carbamoyltransferase